MAYRGACVEGTGCRLGRVCRHALARIGCWSWWYGRAMQSCCSWLLSYNAVGREWIMKTGYGWDTGLLWVARCRIACVWPGECRHTAPAPRSLLPALFRHPKCGSCSRCSCPASPPSMPSTSISTQTSSAASSRSSPRTPSSRVRPSPSSSSAAALTLVCRPLPRTRVE